MTQPQANEPLSLEALAKRYRAPNNETFARRLQHLDRMRGFYEAKVPTAPAKQAALFMGFVSSLSYCMTLMHIHQRMTADLAELAAQEDDGEEE